jgi:hypothetical protein
MLSEAILDEDHNTQSCITFLNYSGDVSITWSPENDAKIKELIRKKMAQGYSFFTMRKVVIDAIQIRRKIGQKGVDSINNLVIDDETFDKMVKGLADSDLADALKLGHGKLAKRRGRKDSMDLVKKLKSADDVIKAKQAVAIKPVLGG